MKNKINLTSNHPDVRRAEYFLNSLEEELREVPFQWNALQRSDYIVDGFRFVSDTGIPVTVTVLLCYSYFEANKIGEVNGFSLLPTTKWGVNGDILYYVESGNMDSVDIVCGIFAGEE